MNVVVEYGRLDETQRHQHEAIDRLLSDGALMVQQTAQAIAPVDTGRYRASISMRDTGPLSFEVYSIVLYGPYLEAGTRNMAAQPTFRPAYERHRLAIIESFKAI